MRLLVIKTVGYLVADDGANGGKVVIHRKSPIIKRSLKDSSGEEDRVTGVDAMFQF